MVAVPSHDGQGTNALLLSPPGAIEPSFGPGSFARHLEVGRQAGLQPTTLALEGVGRDIDTPADLEILANARAGDPRYAFLEVDRIEQSLRTRAAG
jgi:2-phospho-L-lactate guanylyltransferase